MSRVTAVWLVVVFGLFPGLILDIIAGSVADVLNDVGTGAGISLALWQ